MGTRTLLRPVHHHSSHRRLLHREPRTRGPAKVDAIIVPAARDVRGLRPAIRLAQELRCPLVALCSHKAEATTLRERSWKLDAQVIAVDVGEGADLPGALTTRMLAGSPFARRTDTA